MMLVALWLIATVLLPSLVNLAAAVRHPIPSRVALVQATREASNEASARGSQLLGSYYQDHPELMAGGPPPMDFGTRTLAVQAEVDRVVRPVQQEFQRKLDQQESLTRRWRFASPALLAHDALITVAGTDTKRFREYERQVDAYMTRLHDYFAPMVVRGVAFDANRIDAIPQFAFRDVPLSDVVRQVLPGLLALAAGTGLVGVAALSLARRSSSLIAG
jgi:ABC-2 type transport system permease protein